MVVDPVWITFAVTGAAFVLFVTEVLPPDVTSLAAAAALVVTGVLDVDQGLAGFSNKATITVLFMFVLAAGVQRSGLVNRMAHRFIDMAGGRSTRFLVVLVLFSGVVSAFLNNTPVVAIMIPLVITVATRLERSPSKFLIPLSYAAMLGGTMTLIGTSSNLLASSISADLGYREFSMFEFTGVGAIVFLAGSAYLVTVAPRLLPERHAIGEVTERFKLKDYVFEVEIEAGSPLVGTTLEASDLRQAFDVDVIRIFRGDHSVDGPFVGIELAEHDVLLVRASREELLAIREREGLSIHPEVTHGLPGDSGKTLLVEAIVTPGSRIEGATLQEMDFRQRFNAVALAIKKRERLLLRRLGSIRLEAGDTLLLSGSADAIEALKQSHDLVVAEELDVESYRRDRQGVALAIVGGVVLAAAFGWIHIATASLVGVVAMVATGCLEIHEMHEAVRWDVVFLLAGLIPLGIALETTGAAALIAEAIVGQAGGLPPIAVVGVFYLATLLLTQMMSNNASVALMVPVAAEAAATLGLNAVPFILACMFSASMEFMTPIGYQTNLMVYGPGEYRFTDYTKVGAPLNLVSMAATLFGLWLFFPLT